MKSIQLHSEVRRSTSQSHDGWLYKKTFDVPYSNGQRSSSQNGKVIPSSKAFAAESSVSVTKASPTILKIYVRSPSANKMPSFGIKKESLIERKIILPSILKKINVLYLLMMILYRTHLSYLLEKLVQMEN